MSNFKHLLLFISLSWFGSFQVHAQTFPVTANVNIVPPASRYLTDYTAMGSQKLNINLVFNDFTVPSYDVALNFKIDGSGVLMTTPPTFSAPLITLMPGMNTLSGPDVAQYLNPGNMTISGSNQTALRQSGALPDGMFKICVEVTDYRRRDVKLSSESCTVVNLRRNEPPLAMFPSCGSTVTAGSGQNIMFQWQSRHDPAVHAEYLLTMVEVPQNMSPNNAMQASQTPLLNQQVVMGTTSFLYGPGQVQLDPGKTYAYRVDVRDPMG